MILLREPLSPPFATISMTISSASAVGLERETGAKAPLEALELQQLDAWWRAANYLAVGMIYLQANPLLREPLRHEHIKNRLLGHWGSSPGQAFIWAHANRLIRAHGLQMIYLSGPGHGAPGVLGPTYLDGSYSEIYPDKSQDADGLRRFFKQFSFPGHIGSHCTPETPGSIHEGGELGYVLSHACGAVFDNPELIALACVGDGEAETGPLATSWHVNKFLNPISDGAVLPVLHLNGYKIANPSLLARISRDELESLMRGYGWTPLFVEGHEPEAMHQAMAAAMDEAVERILSARAQARQSGDAFRPAWPMIVLRSPKGWTGPTELNGKKLEGFWRSHQVPLPAPNKDPEQLQMLESWLRSYRPEELFDADGTLRPELKAPLPHRRPTHGLQPPCQRRTAAPQAAPAADGNLRSAGGSPGPDRAREHSATGRAAARHDLPQPRQHARVRPRRNRLQPPAGDLRGEQEGVDGGDPSRRQRRQ